MKGSIRKLLVLSAVMTGMSLAMSASAEVTTAPLLNPEDDTDVWGEKITGLGENEDEVALVFTKAGATMTWTPEINYPNVRFLVVGGGGSGGSTPGSSGNAGGGGGAGGMATGVVAVVSAGTTVSIDVGKGGTYSDSKTAGAHGGSGADSKISVGGTAYVIAKGGGYGGGYPTSTGTSGGSGGSAGAAAGNAANTAKAVGTATSLVDYDTTLNLLNADCGVSGVVLGHSAGGKASSAAHGSGGGGAGASGSAGPNNVTAGKTSTGVGGIGAISDITGEEVYYAGGGGGGASDNTGSATSAAGVKWGALGGLGGGGQGGSSNKSSSYGGSLSGANGTANSGGGGGGAGYWTSAHGGNGGSGIVVIRYRLPSDDEAVVPFVAEKTYDGEHQTADVYDGKGYYVASNPGGTDAGDYVVTFVLSNGFHWVGGSTDSTNLTFTITKSENSWTTEPSLSKTAWELSDDAAVVNIGASLSGTEVVVAYDDGETEMPLTLGSHTAIFVVAGSRNYLELSKTIGYTIGKNANAWIVEPSMTKTTWIIDEDPGVVVPGEAKYGEIAVTYDNDTGIEELPTGVGQHTVRFSVSESETYTWLEKTLNYTVTKKRHEWTLPPDVPTTVNVEDGVSFPMPTAEPGVEVTAYFDGDPTKTELTDIAFGETHTVTYAIAGDSDWDEVEQTFSFNVVYKSIVDQIDPSKVYGYRIPKLGENQDEVALVFTNTGYTADNPICITLPQEVTAIEYLAVGGGGGGAGWVASYGLGGGGAGGVVSNTVSVSDASISVVVGKGGTGCTSSSSHNAKSGGASQLAFGDQPAIIAYGGGKGGCAEAGVGGEGYGSGGGGGSKNEGGNYVSKAGGAANPDGQGHAGGNGYTGTSRGGGGGGAGEDGWTPTSTQSGKGGDGIVSDITGEEVWYAGGGGGGSHTNGGIASPGGKGGGGAGGSCPSNQQSAGRNATYYGGGGGGAKGSANGGSGYQGVVIIRYVEPEGVVMVPYIAPKTYTGETLSADVPANIGYTVTGNEGGTDVGDYPVALVLDAGYHWNGGSTEPTNLTFTITQAQNEWTVEPEISRTTWLTTDEPGVLTAGETEFGTPAATIAKVGGETKPFGGVLPTEAGQYVITYLVETSGNWIDPEVTEKSVEFEIVSGDVVPPFTVTKGEMTTVVGEGQVGLSVGYAVECEVVSEKTVDIYAYIAEDGSDTTNEVKVAESVALDATGTGVVPDLKPGVTYWVALGGKGGDTIAPTTEFTAVTMTGPATDIKASVTFTNDPKEFVITGSVTPGIGTTTVTVRWSLNSSALDNSAEFAFAYGDSGAFTQRVDYAELSDKLTWDVAVSNIYISTTYGDLTWDAALPASTKKRTDTVATKYHWIGGASGDWADPNNWSANRAECFGYPDNVDYATAWITTTTTINLGGKMFSLVKGTGLELEANSGDVVTLTNGTLKVEHDKDGDFGAANTTLIFRDATLNRARLNPKSGMTAIFEDRAKLTGMVRPWSATDAKIIFRNGDITIGGNFGNGGASSNTEIIISNATVTVNGQANGTWAPGTFPVKLQNGPDRQARLVHTESHGFDFVQSPYTLAIPSEPYATPYLQAVKPGAFKTDKPTFNIDVTNWKFGRRVPLVKFTSSAAGAAAQYGNATVRAFAKGADVTAKLNARLEWDETLRTLFYKQSGTGGLIVIIK